MRDGGPDRLRIDIQVPDLTATNDLGGGGNRPAEEGLQRIQQVQTLFAIGDRASLKGDGCVREIPKQRAFGFDEIANCLGIDVEPCQRKRAGPAVSNDIQSRDRASGPDHGRDPYKRRTSGFQNMDDRPWGQPFDNVTQIGDSCIDDDERRTVVARFGRHRYDTKVDAAFHNHPKTNNLVTI